MNMEKIIIICLVLLFVVAVFSCLLVAKMQIKHYFKCKNCVFEQINHTMYLLILLSYFIGKKVKDIN